VRARGGIAISDNWSGHFSSRDSAAPSVVGFVRPIAGLESGEEEHEEQSIQQAVRQADGDLGAKVRKAFDERIMKVNPCAGKPAEGSMLVRTYPGSSRPTIVA